MSREDAKPTGRLIQSVFVRVEPKHIAAGARFDWQKCPVALALKEACENVSPNPKISLRQLLQINNKTSAYLRLWLYRFDDGEEVEPFDFIFEAYEAKSYLTSVSAKTASAAMILMPATTTSCTYNFEVSP